MQLEELTNQYRNAHKLSETAQAITTTKNTGRYNPWNHELVEQQAQLLKTRYERLIVKGGAHQAIDELVTQEPARICQAFEKEFSEEDLKQTQQDYKLLTQQRAQAITQYLGTTDLRQHNEEENMTNQTREVLKDLYHIITNNPVSICYDPTSESQVTALDKAWYFGTRQDEKTEATPPDEAKKIIAEMKAELLKEMEAMQKT